MNYNDLSDQKKQDLIIEEYINNNNSLQNIAHKYNTYANKIRRDAIKFGIALRDKSEAQKNALNTGVHKHPTKGTTRPDDTKTKIGVSLVHSWEQLSDNELENRKNTAKKNWEKKSKNDKENMLTKANKAVRQASKDGSKLEKFISQCLIKDNHKIEFHKEQLLANTKLQIDIFLPTMNVAIEVDGPSHFAPVWGDDVFNRNISYDNKKTGLIIGKGLVLIRIKQTKDFSKSRALLIYQELKTILDNIQIKFPPINQRTIEIGD
jgi:very-short-patch-repair endonuclease